MDIDRQILFRLFLFSNVINNYKLNPIMIIYNISLFSRKNCEFLLIVSHLNLIDEKKVFRLIFFLCCNISLQMLFLLFDISNAQILQSTKISFSDFFLCFPDMFYIKREKNCLNFCCKAHKVSISSKRAYDTLEKYEYLNSGVCRIFLFVYF